MVDKQFLDEAVADVLIEGPVHKTMVFFCRAERWPAWFVELVAAATAVLVGIVWAWLSGDWAAGVIVALMHVFWVGCDTAVLRSLPRRQISFGPWKAQLFVLLIPRLTVTLCLALVSLWWTGWGLLLVALLFQVAITAAYVWGYFVEIHRLRLTHLTVVTDRLTADAPSIRLLHLTDLHIERLTKREAEVLRIVKEAQPDLIVITGDYVNLSYNQDPITHAQVHQFLSQLTAPYGVYATLGSPPVDLRAEVVPIFRDLSIKLLRHDCEIVSLGQGRELIVLGMDCTHYLPTDRQRLSWLMEGVPHHAPRLFLYHSPELMPEAAQHNIDLYLCGHTHGGQVRLPLIGPLLTSSRLGRRYVMGLYREGCTHLYVSRGIGLEGLSAPRVRFMAPPEMTLVTLQGKG